MGGALKAALLLDTAEMPGSETWQCDLQERAYCKSAGKWAERSLCSSRAGACTGDTAMIHRAE